MGGTCGCCGRKVPTPYTHSFRDHRDDMDYCQECYDVGCDLAECSLDVDPKSGIHRSWLRKGGVLDLDEIGVCSECGREIPLNPWAPGVLGTHDSHPLTRALCPGSGTEPLRPVSEAELAEVYRSLGVEPPTIPEEGT